MTFEAFEFGDRETHSHPHADEEAGEEPDHRSGGGRGDDADAGDRGGDDEQCAEEGDRGGDRDPRSSARCGASFRAPPTGIRPR